ncbi:hypothetical protein ACOSOMT5_P1075 [Acidiphilium sp. MT5]
MLTSRIPSGKFVAPVMAPATSTGEIVGFTLQNTGTTTLAAQPVTLNEVFKQGAVPAGSGLIATINGVSYQAQLDAKTFNADGSVASGVVTILAPALAAGTSTPVSLSLAPASTAAPVDLASALATYNLTATLNITANAGGATGVQTVNIASLVRSALAANSAQSWLSGPLASEAIVSIPVTGSLRIEADITAYANGQISTTLQFNNDAAMQASGGTISYSATISQNGVTVAQQSNLTQYQYQDWSLTTGTTPPATGLNIQHDIAYLEATGAIPNYDTQYGVSSTVLANEAAAIAAPGWNAPLGTDGITQYMPNVGGRGDIGPTTQANATWLLSQSATAAAYALGQANEAGSIPWHFYDPTSNGSFLNPADYPTIWTDGRGGPGSYTTGLTQQVNPTNSGWTTDVAHTPDLNYVAYMLTGNVVALEQLNAQASFAIDNFWPYPRNNGQAIVASPGNQIRGSAWSLRTIQEAAYANPAGSADKAYFSAVTNANYSYLVSLIPQLTIAEGQAYGYLPGPYGSNGSRLPPWEEDYLASTVIQGAEMGYTNALTFLKWQSNFLVGRFFAQSQGFSPRDGIAYNLAVGNNATGLQSEGPYYQTWAQIEQATQATGQSNVGNNWAGSNGDYGALALQSLAGIITVSVANPTVMGNYQYQAMQAFGWLLNSGAPYLSPAQIAASNPQFLIVPRLANGQLLSFANMVLGQDSAGAATALAPITLTENALLYAGSGTDTLIGGTGINLLFGGAGNDVIFGGPNGNDIFAGAGADTIIAGGGATYIQASSTALLTTGTGQDLFVLNSGASGAVTIAGFNPSLDRLDIVSATGIALTPAQLATIEASATTIAGGTKFALSSGETLFLTSVTGATGAWFSEQNQAVTAPASLLATAEANNTIPAASGGTSNGGSGSTGSGGTPPAPTNPLQIITSGTAQTILGGSGGSAVDSISGATINAQQTGQSDYVTLTGANNIINAQGGAGSFPTYGNLTSTGANNQITITGGVYTETGAGDSVSAPYSFGALTINELGTGQFASLTGTNAVSIGGSGNIAFLTIEASTPGTPSATISGSNDTVTARVYSPILVTGANNIINASGEAAVTISAAAQASANTVFASGFDAITAASGPSFIAAVGGANVMATITTETASSSTIALGANANVSITGAGIATIIDNIQTQGAATVAGFNPLIDQISLQTANGSALTAAQIASIVQNASINGSTATLGLSSGATLTLTDLTSAPQTGWFTLPSSPAVPPPSAQPAPQQTILGAASAFMYDPLSNAAINAQQLGRFDFLTIGGANDSINAIGSAGGYATYGNITTTGANSQITVTGGVLTELGAQDTVISPYSFGALTINELGTGQFASVTGSTRVSVGGSNNIADLTVQSGGGPNPVMATIGGADNIVFAGTYSPVLVTGADDIIRTSGTAAVTMAGAANTGANTVIASGFDAITTATGNSVISIPGGSWNSTITNLAGNDTIFAGAASPGGSNQLAIQGGSGTLIVTDMASGRTITMTAGTGAVTATGANNGSVFIGGTGGDNLLAASGNSTLIGNGGSNTIMGGTGNELLVASTIAGASNSFLINSLTANNATTITGFGAQGTSDSLILQSGLSISQTTTSPLTGTLLTLNDGSKIFLSQFTGSLHSTTTTTGTTLTP